MFVCLRIVLNFKEEHDFRKYIEYRKIYIHEKRFVA